MRNSIKYLLAMILGGVLVGSILVATGVYAQNDVPDEFETSAPTIVDSTLRIDSVFQYQGQLLTSGGTPVNGVETMNFVLYQDSVGGSGLWGEGKPVTVSDGWFTTALGDINAIPDAILDGRNLWLGVQVGTDSETTPRQPIRPAMFAVNSRMLAGHTADHFLKAEHGPVAYGLVDGGGGHRSGYHFESSYNGSANPPRYEIQLKDESGDVSYHITGFTTVVTVLEGSNCPHATIATTNATTNLDKNKLIVYLRKTDNNHTQCDFSFVTIKN